MNRFIKKILTVKNDISKKLLGVYTLAAGLMFPMVSKANNFTGYTGMTSDSIMNGFFTVLGVLGTFAGAIFVGTSAWGYIMAMKSEDPEAKHKASLGFIPGIAFLSFGAIILLFKV